MVRPERTVVVVPFGDVPRSVVHDAVEVTDSLYDLGATVGSEHPLPESAHDRTRDQWRAVPFVEATTRAVEDAIGIGLTTRDLFVEQPAQREYMWGLFREDLGASVVSTYRLSPAGAGAGPAGGPGPAFGGRLRERVAHHVGHHLGLRHCSNDRCVMAGARRLRDVDFKREELCETCRGTLDG
jgi:archaemetzincin